MSLEDKYLTEAPQSRMNAASLALFKYLGETHLKKGQKVKFTDKDDDFYGKTGTVYKVFKNGYTVKIGNKVVSRDDDELAPVNERMERRMSTKDSPLGKAKEYMKQYNITKNKKWVEKAKKTLYMMPKKDLDTWITQNTFK